MKKLPDDMGSLQGLVKLEANGIGIQEVPTSITPLAKLQVLSLAGCKAGESKSRNLVLSLRSSPTEGLPLPSLSASKGSHWNNTARVFNHCQSFHQVFKIYGPMSAHPWELWGSGLVIDLFGALVETRATL
ncbi:hypothetical protein CK203_112181 [Vitis vinifera]|uniref:Uncharacterized protein n=1 Tax=Vitis vinifera TaxID=29760 RepID=A0A438D373_VITVI|nr:hypothetical protein CK203_112181 [Vitis vinifera]